MLWYQDGQCPTPCLLIKGSSHMKALPRGHTGFHPDPITPRLCDLRHSASSNQV